MSRGRRHWLVKSEPAKYSWDQFVADGTTDWDGVRNPGARNNLRAMRVDDLVLYYHSNEGKEVVGIARVTRSAYPDPTSDDPRWVAVELAPVQPFGEPVTLKRIKADPGLREIPLVRQSRLSVMALEPSAFDRILFLGKTRLRRARSQERLRR